MKILSVSAILVVSLSAPSLFAAPITWQIEAETLSSFHPSYNRSDELGTVSGSFDYDPDTNELSNVNILSNTTVNGGLYTSGIAAPPHLTQYDDRFVSFYQSDTSSGTLNGENPFITLSLNRDLQPPESPEVKFTLNSINNHNGEFKIDHWLNSQILVNPDYQARFDSGICLDFNGGFCQASRGGNENSFISTSGIISTEPPTELFLDFDNQINRDFYVRKNPFTGKEFVDSRQGSEPLGQFFSTQKELIVSKVQSIFDTSNINIKVVDTKPKNDSLSVRFSPALENYDANGIDGDGKESRLRGRAYDVLKPSWFGASGADRFDLRKDGVVAVFMDGSDSINDISEIIAHEALHGYGGRHINPLQNNGSEVLDYSRSSNPIITDIKTNIVEPPNDGETSKPTTHNPAYHIRRYVLGEDPDDLSKKESLVPGTWDIGTFELFHSTLNISNLTTAISHLSLEYGIGANMNEFFDSGSHLAPLLEDLPISLSHEFLLTEDLPFQLIASSGQSEIIDIFFGFGQSDNPSFNFDPTTLGLQSGSIFQWNALENKYTSIGDFSFNIESAGFVHPDGSITPPDRVSVSEPNTLILLISGLVLFFVWQYRRQNVS